MAVRLLCGFVRKSANTRKRKTRISDVTWHTFAVQTNRTVCTQVNTALTTVSITNIHKHTATQTYAVEIRLCVLLATVCYGMTWSLI